MVQNLLSWQSNQEEKQLLRLINISAEMETFPKCLLLSRKKKLISDSVRDLDILLILPVMHGLYLHYLMQQ